MPFLLAFGDSNTHGTPPVAGKRAYTRFGPDARWPQVCLEALGAGWQLAEEGLPGRTTSFEDPILGAHMDGRPGLRIALQSHGPIDVLAILLGTNDTKTRFAASPEAILAGLACLIDIALSAEMRERHGGMKILVISPPPVKEIGFFANEFIGAAERSRTVALVYRNYAAKRGISFLDAGSVFQSSDVDGIHFEAEDQRKLGRAAAEAIRRLCGLTDVLANQRTSAMQT